MFCRCGAPLCSMWSSSYVRVDSEEAEGTMRRASLCSCSQCRSGNRERCAFVLLPAVLCKVHRGMSRCGLEIKESDCPKVDPEECDCWRVTAVPLERALLLKLPVRHILFGRNYSFYSGLRNAIPGLFIMNLLRAAAVTARHWSRRLGKILLRYLMQRCGSWLGRQRNPKRRRRQRRLKKLLE
jgi:hypothetical protein